ncbi:MAG: four-carbon acid sugar kinase family protein [bacterium]|nr:four-carbon acid sugar kinase family protein [bacterium]
MPGKDLKIIVLDDDPTGCQTIYGCLLLTSWSPELVDKALNDSVDFFYILTNTRALSPGEATDRISQIVDIILNVNLKYGHKFLFISRSDSTLRSHFPLEVNIIKEKCESFSNKQTDAVFLIPAFIEGGRITAEDIHHVVKDGKALPASETEFAKDSVFGYNSANLREYIEEKTRGSYPSGSVNSISLEELRDSNTARLLERFMQFSDSQYVVVNAEKYEDLDIFSEIFLHAVNSGKNFLIQSAASIVRSLNGLSEKPFLKRNDLMMSDKPGLIIVGSYVQKTTEQYNRLIDSDGISTFIVKTDDIPERSDQIVKEAVDSIVSAIESGHTPVICTSRIERKFNLAENRIRFGKEVSSVLLDIVKQCPADIGYIIAKGGITSADILTRALEVESVRVMGQLQSGVPVVLTPDTCRFPEIPYIIFPGNVGDEDALRNAYFSLKGT